MSNSIVAQIDDATVDSTGGSVDVTATSSPLLLGIGAAGAGSSSSGSFDGAGTADINSIANTVDAEIELSEVTAAINVDVVASEASSLYAVSLAGAGATDGNAVGASIAYNFIGGDIDPADPNFISYDNGTVPGTMVAVVSGDDTTTISGVSALIDSSSVNAGGQVVVQSGFDNPNSLATPGPAFEPTQPIDTSAGVTVTGDALHFGSPHGLETGDAVVYHDGGGTDITGLADGQVYYVVKVDDYTIKLASSYANALAGTVVVLGSTGNAAQTITPFDLQNQITFDPSSTTVSGNIIVFPSADGLSQGEEVAYDDNGGTSIGGLVSGHTYYVIVVSNNTIELANSSLNAKARIEIIFSSTGSGAGHVLTPTLPFSTWMSPHRTSGSPTRWPTRSPSRQRPTSRPATPWFTRTAAAAQSAA